MHELFFNLKMIFKINGKHINEEWKTKLIFLACFEVDQMKLTNNKALKNRFKSPDKIMVLYSLNKFFPNLYSMHDIFEEQIAL